MDLIQHLHTSRREILPSIIGGCEETTTGIHRLKAMSRDGKLEYPVIAVNDTPMKHFFDTVHETGESSLAAIMSTTNILIAGKYVVVADYGYCGRGFTTKTRNPGARVIVTNIDSRRALQAHFDGFAVMTIRDAAQRGELFITTTGNVGVLTGGVFALMRDGAILCNSGHFNVEIDVDWLEKNADHITRRDGIDSFTLNNRVIPVLAEGRLVNLAVPKGIGHSIEGMDLSFAVQALSTEYILTNGARLPGQC